MDIQDWYVRYLTFILFIMGFIIGITHVFAVMSSYNNISEYGYNDICKDTFGNSYVFDEYNPSTTAIMCMKESNSRTALKRMVYLN